MRFWSEFWPQVLAVSFLVGVAGNLTASAILGAPALWHLHRKLNRQHRERLDQASRHHDEMMAALGQPGHVREEG